MDKKNTLKVKLIALLISFSCLNAFSQATIKVTVTSVTTSGSVDCDGFLQGDSDFVWEYTATDNTLGYTNNTPALFGIFDFNYTNTTGNGPINFTANALFFDRQYICPSDVPITINLAWEAYENDDAGNYDVLGLTDGESGLQNVSMAVPATPGIANYSFSASGSAGCPSAVNYTINLTVERVNLATTVIILPDDICNATLMNTNTSYNVAICQSNTLQPNEPRAGDVDVNQSSAWFRFVAPASGAVEISTDNGGTEIGTYFQIYHAADGGACNTGLQPLTSAVIKDKFEYLSHIQFSDGIDELGLDPEAQLTLDACDPLPLISYQKLIAGETYYVQLTQDDTEISGLVEVRINDLGGSPSGDSEDIPCQSPSVTYGTNVISTDAGAASVTLDFGCAYDGGNDYAETGAPRAVTDYNPENYHAYDYDHVAANNPVVNESVWLNFVAPNSGRMIFEADYQSGAYGENNALFGYDVRFSPGVPSDYSCANLEFIAQDEGGTNSFLGGDPSARIDRRCLEPGYKYYGMVDPSDNLTPFSSQSIKSWLYDPSISDPTLNSPGNDILCLTMQNPLYEVPVILANTNPTFQAVAGSNVFSCREFLAGEPASESNPANRADQTVWHYFTAPPSGAVELSIRAYIGLDLLRYNVFKLLNGIDCYGGLQPATYTEDGTRNTAVVTPIISGTAGFSGTQTSACCLEPGKIYAIQIDGGSPGDVGQYIIEYIREVASDAGDIYVALANGDTVKVTQPDTAYICFGDTIAPGILLNGIGESTADLPSCLVPGYILHSSSTIPSDISTIVAIDTVQSIDGVFVNNGSGNGTFGNPNFNQLYYLSPAGDLPATWGDFSCISSTLEQGIPIVFLQNLNAIVNYDNVTCTVSFSATGGLSSFNNLPYSYTITNPLGGVAQTGNLTPGATINYTGSIAGIYTLTINDGSCPKTFTFDATNCGNPCEPVTVNVSKAICQGASILLGGQLQTLSGVYTDVFPTPAGCDSTVITTLTVLQALSSTNEQSICPGTSVQVGTSTYTSQGVYTDVLQSVDGCDSVVTTVVFMLPYPTATIEASFCEGGSYLFGGVELTEAGVYQDTVFTPGSCDTIRTLVLTVENCEFLISNVITPNGDGQNDTWKVSDQTVIAGCTVKIYNRWGQPVYETVDYNNEWGGTKNGENLPDGVYFYSIKCDSKEYTGSINLLRFKQ